MDYKKLFISFSVVFLVAFIASNFTLGSITEWYSTLNKPSFTPPNWVFGPVWTFLYTLIAISFYMVWEKRLKGNSIYAFSSQLLLNGLWSVIFFGLQSPFYALLCIVLLWLTILWTFFEFFKISKTAAYLFVPYFGWVTFAGILNYAIWQLN